MIICEMKLRSTFCDSARNSSKTVWGFFNQFGPKTYYSKILIIYKLFKYFIQLVNSAGLHYNNVKFHQI